MKFKMISDTAARVRVKAESLEKIMRPQDRYNGGTPVTLHGCWVKRGGGGWVTIAAFGSDAQAERDLIKDLEALSDAESN